MRIVANTLSLQNKKSMGVESELIKLLLPRADPKVHVVEFVSGWINLLYSVVWVRVMG